MKHLLTILVATLLTASCFSQSKKDTTQGKFKDLYARESVQIPKLTDSTNVAVILTWKEWQNIFALLRVSAGASGAQLETTIQYMTSKAQMLPKK